MNLSEDLSVDKELFSGVYEGKYKHLFYNCRNETDVRHPINLCFNNSDLRNIIFEYAGLLML
jgi:hypothetical protein